MWQPLLRPLDLSIPTLSSQKKIPVDTGSLPHAASPIVWPCPIQVSVTNTSPGTASSCPITRRSWSQGQHSTKELEVPLAPQRSPLPPALIPGPLLSATETLPGSVTEGLRGGGHCCCRQGHEGQRVVPQPRRQLIMRADERKV